MSTVPDEQRETTSTDDIRQVREKLSTQFNGDVRAQGDYATRTTEALMERLGLRRAVNVKQGAATKSA